MPLGRLLKGADIGRPMGAFGVLHAASQLMWSTFTMGVVIYGFQRVHDTEAVWERTTKHFEVKVAQMPEFVAPVWVLIPPKCTMSMESAEAISTVQLSETDPTIQVDCDSLVHAKSPTWAQTFFAWTWTSHDVTLEGLHRNRLQFFWCFGLFVLLSSVVNWVLAAKSLLEYMEVKQASKRLHPIAIFRMVALMVFDYFFITSLTVGIGQLFDTYSLDGGYVMLFIPVPGIVIFSVFLLFCMIIDIFDFGEEFFRYSITGSVLLDFAILFVVAALMAAPFFFYCMHFYYKTSMTKDFEYEAAVHADMVSKMDDIGTVAQFLFKVSLFGYVFKILEVAGKATKGGSAIVSLEEKEDAYVSLERSE